jgi:hydroxymethylpyrimidine/phosphomethylpyrimidine kinase
VQAAKAYITAAIRAADRLHVGRGHGPVHHFYRWWPPQNSEEDK